MKNAVATIIAVSVGLLVLVAYFLDLPAVDTLQAIFLSWAMILAAAALFIGAISLLLVHVDKLRKRQKNSFYSLIVILSLLATLSVGLLLGPGNQVSTWIFTSIQIPIEKSLMALLVVTLTLSGIRLLRQRPNLLSVIFILTGIVIFLGTAPLPFGEIPLIGSLIRPFIIQIPATAGARGILLGVALGTLATGVRILLGAERPYGNK